MNVGSFLSPAILIALTAMTAAAEDIPIRGDIPIDIQAIDLTYSETGPPRLSFRSTPPPHPAIPPFRPSTPQFDLQSVLNTAALTGSCEASDAGRSGVWAVTIQAGSDPCRALMEVRKSPAVDVLSYGTMILKGYASQPVIVSLVDGFGQSSVALTRVVGHFDVRMPLKPVISRLDPTHVTAILFEADAGASILSLERFLLQRTSVPARIGSKKGFWVWDYRAAVEDPGALIQHCRRAGVTRMLVQMPDGDDPPALWSAYAGLLQQVTQSGLEIFALDGYPEAIYDPAPLMDKISRLRRLLPRGTLAGLQLDIEPYLLAQFSDPHDYGRYLLAIENIKAVLGEDARLSVVMPFWFSAKTVHHRPLDFEVMDRADEVAVMSYRTDLDDLQDITEHTLRYGDAAGEPVWLAVETRPLPVDRQVTLLREPRTNAANAYLDRAGRRLVLAPPSPEQTEGFRVAHHITIRPERLTFAGGKRHELNAALDRILAFSHPSLAGVLIHDLPGYFSLAE
jgi:hypothetical protein